MRCLENVFTLIEFGNGFRYQSIPSKQYGRISTNQFHDIYPEHQPGVYDDVYDMIFPRFAWLQRIEKICIEQLYLKNTPILIGRISDVEIPVIIVNLMPFPVRRSFR